MRNPEVYGTAVSTPGQEPGRYNWTIPVLVSVLVTAVAAKAGLHNRRFQHWSKVEARKLAQLRKKGFTVERETELAAQYSTSALRGGPNRKVVRHDERLVADFRFAETKRVEHERALDQARQWTQFLARAKRAGVKEYHATFSDLVEFGLIS